MISKLGKFMVFILCEYKDINLKLYSWNLLLKSYFLNGFSNAEQGVSLYVSLDYLSKIIGLLLEVVELLR